MDDRDLIERLDTIKALAGNAMSYAKAANNRIEKHDETAGEWVRRIELAVLELVNGLTNLKEIVEMQTASNKMSERERWLFKLLALAFIAVIVIAMGRAGVDIVGEYLSKTRGIP